MGERPDDAADSALTDADDAQARIAAMRERIARSLADPRPPVPLAEAMEMLENKFRLARHAEPPKGTAAHTSKDHPVTDADLVLVERTDPRAYRDWCLVRCGGVEILTPEIRSLMPGPEEELKDLLALMQSGDELWIARSRHYEPKALIGNMGIAIVRNGKPVWYRVAFHH